MSDVFECNIEHFMRKVRKLGHSIEKGSEAGLKVCGSNNITTLRNKITFGKRSGKTYKGMKQSSAPGEYPKKQSGKLISSLRYSARPGELELKASTSYAKHLEKIRPYLSKILKDKRAANIKIVKKSIIGELES